MSFSWLGLSEPLQRAVAAWHYEAPTPIQAATIPAILAGRDVWGCAQTGSGKTAAFALPLVQKLATSRRPSGRFVSGLVLVPTRELATQVVEVIRRYARYLPQPLKTLVAVGGLSINPQMIALGGGADLLVATPGRLLDLLDHHALSLAEVTMLVLDEADRLLDLGFKAELDRIIGLLPPRRQSLLFSATFPDDVRALASALLRNPLRIEKSDTLENPPTIIQRVIEVDVPRRTQLLRHLIETQGWSGVLVFVATKYATEHVAEKLARAGIAAAALHGELSQGARTQALLDLKLGNVKVLIATDLAARGIDIPKLPAVVNYDLPRSAVDYTHRIGRTGRAGEAGLAISFVSASTHAHFSLIEKLHSLTIEREQLPGFEPRETEVTQTLVAPVGGGIKGRRKSKKDKIREVAARSVGELPPVRVVPPAPARFSPAKSPQSARYGRNQNH
ncbi:MAG: DEAD/DEAH box helicase [Verrucomicrobia bacterium]|nr:MAG: DEAD/DEAH box helicase [Verrucomicrobiota bacterium]